MNYMGKQEDLNTIDEEEGQTERKRGSKWRIRDNQLSSRVAKKVTENISVDMWLIPDLGIDAILITDD